MEQKAEWQVHLKIDEEGSFDYDDCNSLTHTIQDMKNMLFEEIEIIKKMNLL